MTSKPVIAIDGPAASGKGTLARKLAQALSYAYMDTGTLYRSVALETLQAGGDPQQENDALQGVKTLQEKLNAAASPDQILGNPDLRTDEIGLAASRVAAQQPVRKALLDIQKDFAANPGDTYKGAILDGRDIGTVICPKADLKLFVTARDTVRAERRLKELQSKGIPVTYEAVLADMRDRDTRDAHTLDAHRAAGYETNVLDTSDLTPQEAFDKALQLSQAIIGH
ncbi:MAG: (d)CMP kinase [Alphaproteobacteria bacterium]|nr:(d)CMP kinase [Alphaproteobacteria bacterium]